MDDQTRTLWCGNLSEKVTEELLWELFLQVAPLERVRIPTDKSGRKTNYGFVTVKHECSVSYAVRLLDGTPLFDRRIIIKPKGQNVQQPSPGDMYRNPYQHNRPHRQTPYQRYDNHNHNHNHRPNWNNNNHRNRRRY
ncbi:RNA-binding protein 7 [Tribolium castaneum]|uniref:RNA-binding protein 7-like Protein n=1 Tax=Tribolium castaneum TaxID=7070 RepID=D7EIV9_TRICA|nr:PREDICTED: RNA-binding protein 7 [Tribolium castaneum]EFA12354.1 RNA-binding protein 7-like Protein [Tribolium castaneum]|eukprot:XP_968713.1 PREDICTED: RNA-binding protein 7 [Tribolium castaneum]